jgi:uncharacterized small protein (DUF1192 family)
MPEALSVGAVFREIEALTIEIERLLHGQQELQDGSDAAEGAD